LLERLFTALPAATRGAFAPGRVNLIGEHVDYSGLPVLPFAIQLGVAIAAAPQPGGTVTVRHRDTARFPEETFALADLPARKARGTWVDYVVAGLRLSPPPTGQVLLVDGDLPIASGLSSSSAAVCAAALLFVPPAVDRYALAEAARTAEQYVGTLSGGMDQATALLGREHHALHIRFRPLRADPVPVPHDLVVVVADSGIRAEKGGAAQQAYNDRVRQCAAAALLLGALPGGLLADVPGGTRAARAAALADPLLARRARFVFAESERVTAAVAALRAADLRRLGELLDASHAGLRDDYEVSHPRVDELVRAAKAAGALGARIVGAGFGGSCIALCERHGAAAVAERLVAAGAVMAFTATPSAGAISASRG
jgi:galactokinase